MTAKNMENTQSTKAVKFNVFDSEYKINPYPTYERLRTGDPIHSNKKFGPEEWLLTRFADIKAVLDDSRFGVDDLPKRLKNKSFYLQQDEDFNGLTLTISKWLFFLDPPDHNRLRGVISNTFSRREVDKLRPYIHKVVNDLLDSVEKDGVMEVMSDLACPLPAIVMAKILGVPNENLNKLIKWGRDLFRVFDQPVSLEGYEHMNRVALEFKDFFSNLIIEREKRPKEDLISNLIAARDQDEKLSQEEILAFCAMFFSVGQETTENSIGNSIFALLTNPEKMAELKREPTIIKDAVEELLRYDSPVQFIARIAIEDVEIGGKIIRAGERVHLCLGAAHRDPAQFYQPDCIDFNRSNKSLPFARGIHFCLGAALARAQTQIAINTILARFHDLKLATDTLEWKSNLVLRGLKSLPIKFTSKTT